MKHYLIDKPIDLYTEGADLEYMKEQLSVAMAIQANPIILQHMQRQVDDNCHDLLNFDALKDSPDLAKAKLIQKQASVNTTAYYIKLVNSIEAMTQLIQQAASNPQE